MTEIRESQGNNGDVIIRPLAMIMHYEEIQMLANVINETLAEEKKENNSQQGD